MRRLLYGVAMAAAVLVLPPGATAQTLSKNSQIVIPSRLRAVCTRSSCGVGYVTICRRLGRIVSIDASHCR